MKTLTKLLKHAALLAVTIAVSKDGAMLSSTTVPNDSFWGLKVQTLVCDDTGNVVGVDCGTQTVKAVESSTGTFVRKAASGDCFKFQGVNDNGSTFPTFGVYAGTACP